MRINKWILALIFILLASPTHASDVSARDGIELLKFEDINSLMIRQNPTIKINDNTRRNLRDAIEALRDSKDDKRDLEDAIDGLEDALDGLNQAIDGQDILIENLQQMLVPGDGMPGQTPGLEEGLDPGEEQDPDQEDGQVPGQTPGPGEIPGMPPALDPAYQQIVGSQIATLQYIKGLYSSNIATLEQNIESLENQIKEFEKLPAREKELEKTIMQIEMADESIIWGAKNLYLGYNALSIQRQDLIRNLEVLDDQIDIVNIQKALGMVTSLDLDEIKKQREELIFGIKALDTQMDNLLGEFNLMIDGQYNELFELDYNFDLDEEEITGIEYENDLKLAKENSYSTKLKEYDYEIQKIYMEWEDKHGDSDSYKAARRDFENIGVELGQEDSQIELTFFQAYQDLTKKLDIFKNEKANFEHEEKKHEIEELKYELGMISRLDMEQARSAYYSQDNKVKVAEQDLFQIMLQYRALTRGMNFAQ